MAQESDDKIIFDWDLDKIFEDDSEPAEVTKPEAAKPENTRPPATRPPATRPATSQVLTQMQRTGLIFTTGYEFSVGMAPGWYAYPWSDEATIRDYYLDRGIILKTNMTIDAQISSVFRVVTKFSIEIPPVFRLTLGDFYFDYNFFNKAFLRAGKFDMSWGISPNYAFTNLLARVPVGQRSYEPYTFRVNYPVGIGGLQLVTITRALTGTTLPKLNEFGYGAKYNFSYRSVSYDFGMFYQDAMPFRSFLSVKTTLWKIEFYTEGLIAIDINNNNNISGAANFGLERAFLKDNLSINGEIFFNGEKNTYWYQRETNFKPAEVTPFVEELNLAFNVSYKLSEKGKPKIYLGVNYIIDQKSALITPGFSCEPLQHISISLAAPISVGDKNGYYYINTPQIDPRPTDTEKYRPLPFAVILLVTIKGSASFRNN